MYTGEGDLWITLIYWAAIGDFFRLKRDFYTSNRDFFLHIFVMHKKYLHISILALCKETYLHSLFHISFIVFLYVIDK